MIPLSYDKVLQVITVLIITLHCFQSHSSLKGLQKKLIFTSLTPRLF